MDELIGSGAASPTPNRETTYGRHLGSSPVPEGPVPIGSLVLADEPVAVPIYGKAESLNLAAAAAVCLYASARAQRVHRVTGQAGT